MYNWQSIDWSNPVSNHHLNDGKIGWWLNVPPFIGALGNTTNSVKDLINLNHGSPESGNFALNNRLNGWGSWEFEGGSARINFQNSSTSSPFNFDRLDPYTISFWAKRDVSTAGAFVARALSTGNSSGWMIWFAGTEIQWRFISTSDVANRIWVKETTSNTNTTDWFHWVCSYSPGITSPVSAMKMYLNGQPVPITTVTDALTLSTSISTNLYAGCRQPTSLHFDGQMDDLSIWARGLNDSEVYELYEKSLNFNTQLLRPGPKVVSFSIGPKIIAVGTASEIDVALSINSSKTVNIGLATETDSSLNVQTIKQINVATAPEIDSGLNIVVTKQVDTTIALEIDSSLNITLVKQVNVSTALEVDIATSVTTGTVISVGVASEIDSSFSIFNVLKVAQVNIANETDIGLLVSIVGPPPIELPIFGALIKPSCYSWQTVDWTNPLTDHPLNDNLAAWWISIPLFDGGSEWTDITNNGNNGILQNLSTNTWKSSSHKNGWGSVEFDGSSSYVERAFQTNDSLDITISDARSVSFWAKKLSNINDPDGIFNWVNDEVAEIDQQLLAAYFDQDDENGILIGQRGTDSGLKRYVRPVSSFPIDSWHHYTITILSSTDYPKLYIDGTLIPVEISAASIAAWDSNVVQIGRGVSSGFYSNAQVNDVRIYPGRELSESDVFHLYENSLNNNKALLNRPNTYIAGITSSDIILGISLEIDSANLIQVIKAISLNTALEIDFANSINPIKTSQVGVGLASETDTSFVVNVSTTEVCHYTDYDGVGDYYNLSGGFITVGPTVTQLSGSCWIRVQSGFTTSMLFGESGLGPINDRGWSFFVHSDGRIFVIASDDGTFKAWQSAAGQISLNTWTHLQFSYDSGTIVVRKDDVEVAQASNTTAAAITRTDEFAIGARGTGTTAENTADCDISRIVIEEAVWSAFVANQVFGNTIPSGAYQFPAGDGTEIAQGLGALTENGDPTKTLIDCLEFPILSTLGLASEVDTALAITVDQSAILGLVSEIDIAFAITVNKSVTLGLASETDTALLVASGQLVTLGLASETDVALPITVNKSVTLGLASETDIAFTVTVDQPPVVGLASETDIALAITINQSVILGIASETDLSLPILYSRSIALGLASEIDTSNSLLINKSYLVQIATETDIGLNINSQPIDIGISTEIDQALSISAISSIPDIVVVGISTETDTALPVVPIDGNVITCIWQVCTADTALEKDTALPVVVDIGFIIQPVLAPYLVNNPYDGLIADPQLIQHEQMISSVINTCGVCCTLVFSGAKWIDCAVCNQGLFTPDGLPVISGSCPYCNDSKVPVEETLDLTMAVEFEKSKFRKIASVNINEVDAQIMTHVEYCSLLAGMDHIILDTCNVCCNNKKYKLAGRPTTCGFGRRKAFIMANLEAISG